MLLTHLQTAVITVLLRDLFALLRESGTCRYEAEEMGDRQDELAGRSPEARLLILPKVKVSVTEVRKAKESNGKKKSSEFARNKGGKKENPWTREPESINDKSQLIRLRRHSSAYTVLATK